MTAIASSCSLQWRHLSSAEYQIIALRRWKQSSSSSQHRMKEQTEWEGQQLTGVGPADGNNRLQGRAAVTGSYASVATPSDPPRSCAMLIRSFKSLVCERRRTACRDWTRRLPGSCLRSSKRCTPTAFHVSRTPTSTVCRLTASLCS